MHFAGPLAYRFATSYHTLVYSNVSWLLAYLPLRQSDFGL